MGFQNLLKKCNSTNFKSLYKKNHLIFVYEIWNMVIRMYGLIFHEFKFWMYLHNLLGEKVISD